MLFKFVLILLVAIYGVVESTNVARENLRGVNGQERKEKNTKSADFDENARRNPVDCAAIYLNQQASGLDSPSNVYRIYPRDGESFKVPCDMQTDGGGWTIIQRRGEFPPREVFLRGWKDYKEGFGNGRREFWLGNDHISLITNQDVYDLRFDMEDFDGNKRYAVYSGFRVANESDDYRMAYDSFIGGDAGDSMTGHSGMKFTTKDRDNDLSTRYGNCAQTFKGAWWYKDCHFLNPNGERNNNKYGEGINWHSWHGYSYSLRAISMKIRPSNFKS